MKQKLIALVLMITIIISILSITINADSYSSTSNNSLSVGASLQEPISDIFPGKLSIVIETADKVYIGDISQKFTSYTKNFVDAIKKNPQTNRTQSSTEKLIVSQVGATNTTLELKIVNTITYTSGNSKLGHIIYFYLVNESGERIFTEIEKATIIVEDAFTVNRDYNFMSVVYKQNLPNNAFQQAYATQPPKYKYQGRAYFLTGRDSEGRAVNRLESGEWDSDVSAKGSNTISYDFNVVNDKFNIYGKDEWTDLDIHYTAYKEIPLYRPNDINYIGIKNEYVYDIESGQIISKTYEGNRTKFFDQITTTNIVAENIDVGDSFSSWITTAINGFIEFEPIPNISLGDILSIIVSLALFFYILKVFAGG